MTASDRYWVAGTLTAAALGLINSQFFILELLGPWSLLLYGGQLGVVTLLWVLWRRGRSLPDAKLIWGVLLVFLAATLAVFAGAPRTGMDCDLPGFHAAGAALIASGQIIRGDYPFLANFYFALPALLADGLRGYEIWFGLQNILLWAACLGMMRRLAGDLGQGLMPAAWPFLAATAPMMGWLIIARYDVLPVFLGLLGVFCWRQGRAASAVAVLALGLWVKFFTALMVPPLLLALLVQGRVRALTRSLAALAAVLAAPFLWFSPRQLLKPFLFQGGRSLTGESLLYQLYHAVDFTDKASRHPWEGVPVQITVFAHEHLSAFLMAAILAWYAFSAARLWRCRQDGPRCRDAAAGLSAGAVLVFVLCNRMYSEQFIIWLWALVPLVYLVRPPGPRQPWPVAVLAALMAASTFNPAHFALSALGGEVLVLCRAFFWAALLSAAWLALDLGRSVRVPRLKKSAVYLGGLGLLLATAQWMHVSHWAWVAAGCLLAASALLLWPGGVQRAVLLVVVIGSLAWSVWNLAQPNVWVDRSGPDVGASTGQWAYCCRYDPFPPGMVTARALVKPAPSGGAGQVMEVELTAERGQRVVAGQRVAMRPGGRWVELSTGVLRRASEIEFRARLTGAQPAQVTRLQFLWRARGLTLAEIMEIWAARGAGNWLVLMAGLAVFSLGLAWLEAWQRRERRADQAARLGEGPAPLARAGP